MGASASPKLVTARPLSAATRGAPPVARGVVPFVAIQLLVLAVVWMYEPLATTLPRWIFR